MQNASYRRVSLAQLERFARTRTESSLRASAEFLCSPAGLTGRARASAQHLTLGWSKVEDAWGTAAREMEGLAKYAQQLEEFSQGLEATHQTLEREIRDYTFTLKELYEKQGANKSGLRGPSAQREMRQTYKDLVAWRTVVGQHCAGVREQLERGDATHKTQPHPLGPVVWRNSIHPVVTCAVDDARAFTVEKFGIAPEVHE